MTDASNTQLIHSSDQESMLFYAFRYALGRRTYAVQEVASVIKGAWPKLQEQTRKQIIREIEDADRRGGLGMECDRREWLSIVSVGAEEEKVNSDLLSRKVLYGGEEIPVITNQFSVDAIKKLFGFLEFQGAIEDGVIPAYQGRARVEFYVIAGGEFSGFMLVLFEDGEKLLCSHALP